MVAVIGDVHGCFYTLKELYNQVKQKYNNVPIYIIGDMVDRGLNSRQVMQLVISERILFTPGNHDYMFYSFFKEPSSIFARSWVFNGNETTLASYENHEDLIFDHIEHIIKAPLFYDTEDCFISHAGISSTYITSLPSDYQADLSVLYPIIRTDHRTDRGVLWNRDELLDLGKLQVVGHTKQKEITFVEESNALYIDTGACVGNKLSCVIIHKNEVVDTIEVST
ncbi:MAG: diadenosine tetraphosphatase, partial [Methanobacteriota archaeon]